MASEASARKATAPPIGAAIEELPDILDPVRVAADQAGDDMVVEVGHDGELAPVERGIAEAGQPVLRLELERDEIPPGARDDDLGGGDFEHQRPLENGSGNMLALAAESQ